MQIGFYLLLLILPGALLFPGCSNDVDDPIDDRVIYYKDTPAQEPYAAGPPISLCTDDTDTGTDSDFDTESLRCTAAGY